MRNLRNTSWRILESPQQLELTASGWDLESGSIICAFGPSETSPLLQLSRWHPSSKEERPSLVNITSWDAPCPIQDVKCDSVLDIHHFSDSSTISVVLAAGDIYVVREFPADDEEKIEIVGSVDIGISAVAWSPDEELLTIVTRADTLLYMTRDFDNVSTATLTHDDLQTSKHVSVGWGKKETQFTGKGAKALRDPTMPEKVDEGLKSPRDDQSTTISWRGDGAYVAVNSIQASPRRVIRVYSREGALDGVSEPVDGLESALSWRPAGNLLAGIQRLRDRVDVVFFERNGLRHGQFSLRLSIADMNEWAVSISLSWNVDSSILAVSFPDRVQLWTMGNYHWYLKQELFIPAEMTGAHYLDFRWNPEQPLVCTIGSSQSLYLSDFVSHVEAGTTISPEDYGIVSVIDGNEVKLTPFRVANIPPPMALQDIKVNHSVTNTAVYGKGSETKIAVLERSRLSIFAWNLKMKPIPPPSILASAEVQITGKLQQVVFVDPENVLLLASDGRDSSVHALRLMSSRLEYLSHSLVPCAKGIFVNYSPIDATPYLQFAIANRLATNPALLDPTGELVSDSWTEVTTFPKEVQHLKIVDVQTDTAAHTPYAANSIETQTIAFGLTSNGSLFANERRLAKDCTSFLVTSAHLVYTSSQNLLKFVHMVTVEELEIPPDTPELDERYTFIKDIVLFVDQIGKIEHIDLFLSQLREEDVSKTMYQDTIRRRKRDLDLMNSSHASVLSKQDDRSKVNRICDAFLTVLQRKASTNLQNIITSHVCKYPQDLNGGLLEVAKLQTNHPEEAEKAVEHICFLADVNRLYDNALGLYDLDLTLLVAQQSQKDPREYLPFLQKLQELSSVRKRFTIDDYLCRYSKALASLHALNNFEDFKLYVVKHTLYKDALHLCRHKEDSLKEVTRLYAECLMGNTKYKEAGIAFEYVLDFASAYEAYRLAHLWKEALFCATLIPLPKESLQSSARAIAASQQELKDFYSAAIIHQDYLRDVESAARLYCKGYFFADALRILSLDNRSDDLEKVVDVGLVEAMATTTELLAECKAQINAQVPRLRELRIKKEEEPLAFYDGDVNESVDIPDNISLAATDASTTGGSLFTRYTNRTGTVGTNATRKTSKNKRREERKRARGKKGSVYEEEYLVNSIGRLMDRVNAVREEVESLVVGLLRRGMRERARAVEGAMVEVVGLCKECVREVFLVEDEGVKREEKVAGGAVNRPNGADGVMWDSVEVAQAKREVPVIKDFGRLSLLGGSMIGDA
ncbi:hypothetical protein MMC13_003871 [Lambiella insularis]|nr:hypothetical protein [Lambiella insularis]